MTKGEIITQIENIVGNVGLSSFLEAVDYLYGTGFKDKKKSMAQREKDDKELAIYNAFVATGETANSYYKERGKAIGVSRNTFYAIIQRYK